MIFDRFKKKKEDRTAFTTYPHLLSVKPREQYVFHSDYFKIDDGYASILSFFHTEGATDNFPPFWGINRIPSGLADDVKIVSFEQIHRMTEGWISDHQAKSEGIASMSEKEQERAGSNTTRHKASRRNQDLEEIARELQDGASYLHAHYRLLVKAPTLEKLDEALKKIERLYIDRFVSLSASPYIGCQRRELSSLFYKNERKRGRGFYFTSTELAGSYSLVTHGLEDIDGEYVGYMVGDVNNSAVLFNVNGYSHHIVVANEQYDSSVGRIHIPDIWGAKIAQSCLLNDHKVVHFIMDGANLDKLSPPFKSFTYRVDMNQGDINLFEMFGSTKNELSIFPAQMQKLVLMAEQAYETTDSDRSIIRGSLEEIATQFYIDNRMWRENAAANRDKLRVTGLPHKEVPKLEMFVSYLDMEYKKATASSARDEERLHALSVLRVTFRNLLSNNGDLFNTWTNPIIDNIVTGRRVIYDFSNLMIRGIGVAMAQFVNIVGYAISNLGEGDTVLIHGAEQLDDGIKKYITMQFNQLYDKGGRVAFLYNDFEKMLEDQEFSHFDKADYTIFGNMSENLVAKYQEKLGQDIPPDLASLITNKSETVGYIRREFDNVVFHQDLSLGMMNGKKGRRRR